MKPVEERFHALLVKSNAGDAVAYHVFLKELSIHLRAFFRKRLVQLPDEVEDLVQEALLAVHNHRHTYDPNQPVTAWIHAIARYKLADLLRRRTGQDALNNEYDDEMELFATYEVDAADAQRDISKLLAQLPDRLRLPIQYVKIDGMSVSEAARQTGMTESAVKVGIHRGLKALAARMKAEK